MIPDGPARERARPRVLAVSPFTPYPPRAQGIAIRHGVVLPHLAARADLTLAIISTPSLEADPRAVPPPDALADVRVHRRETAVPSFSWKVRQRFRRLAGRDAPYRLSYHDDAAIERFLRGIAAPESWDVVLWIGPYFLQSALEVFDARRIVWDAIDSVSLLAARALEHPAPDREVAELRLWERRIAARVRTTIFCSAVDREFSLGNASETSAIVIPNGFLEDLAAPTAEPVRRERETFCVGFLGNMSYPPNVSAALALARICDTLRQQGVAVRLLIIGRNPTAAVQALGNPWTEVTGEVESVAEQVARADVMAFPMREGAGLQNKVLDAMQVGRAIVCTPIANGGIGAEPDRDLLLAESDAEFVAALRRLATDSLRREELARSGAAFVRRRFAWDAILGEFSAAVLPPSFGPLGDPARGSRQSAESARSQSLP